MSRFLALLSASDPSFVNSVESANGTIVSVFAPGAVIIDGDDSTQAAVAQLSTVTAASPVDAPLDSSGLQLDDDTAEAVAAWNELFDPSLIAAKQNRFRGGEAWDIPGGCVIEEEDVS
jgi:hypothetical protein